jgi:hypothetical protein
MVIRASRFCGVYPAAEAEVEMNNVYRVNLSRLVGARQRQMASLAALWLMVSGCPSEMSTPGAALTGERTALTEDGPVVEATNRDRTMQLSATVISGSLSVQVTGFPSGAHFNLLLDTDDAATGFDSPDWFTDSGADYLVTDAVAGTRRTATVAAYLGPNFTWQPALANPRVDAQFADGSVSVSVGLELLGIKTWDRPIGIGFQVVGTDWKSIALLPGKPKFAKLDPTGRKWDSLNCRYADEILPVPAPPPPGAAEPDYAVGAKGLVIPAYVTPDKTDEWNLLKQAAGDMGGAGDFYVVVAGPDKGPPPEGGFAAYRTQWNDIRTAGGRIFGYIHPCIDCLKDVSVRTAQFESLSKLEADVASWVNGYPELDGIWIDEFYPQYELKKPGSTANGGFWNGPENAPSERCFENADGTVHSSADVDPTGGYFDQLRNWIRGTYPQLRIIGNVGTRLISNLELYGNLVDVLVSFEQSISVAQANNWTGLTPPLAKVDRPQLALIHEALTEAQTVESVQQAFNRGYTHVYATDGLYSGNAWGHVTQYLPYEVAAITGNAVRPYVAPGAMNPANAPVTTPTTLTPANSQPATTPGVLKPANATPAMPPPMTRAASVEPAPMPAGATTPSTSTQPANTATDPTLEGGAGSVTLQRDGFTLTLTSEDPQLSAQTALDIQNTFFATIKPESDYFDPNCPHDVTIVVQPNLVCSGDAVPACAWTDAADRSKAYILVDGEHLRQNPQDYDLITHEAMHVVQSLPAGLGECGYWVEGEADLARAWWGLNNAAAGWVLPAPDPSQSYTASYRVTAAFLEWIYESFGEAPIVALDASLRAAICPGPDFWSEYTGYASVDALWNDYVNGVAAGAANPTADAKPTEETSTVAEPAADPKPTEETSPTAEPSSAADPELMTTAESGPEPSADPEAPTQAEPSTEAAPVAPDIASNADSARESAPADPAQVEAQAEADAEAQTEADPMPKF